MAINKQYGKKELSVPLLLFISIWIVINLIQATLTKLDGDEAYYWMFSQQLAWGYFDHPPMVALSVKLGELISHGEMFTRLGAILFSAGAIFLMYRSLPGPDKQMKIFVLIVASGVLFNVYGFITTPDSPLLFFTGLFFVAYKKYLEKEDPVNIMFLALSVAGMLYSKYHGVLPVFFVFLSNPKLIFKRSAWAAVGIVLILITPHFLWQYQHDWPTIRYHLFERISSAYRVEKTTNYFLGQLVVWGPLTTIPSLYLIYKIKSRDVYLRAHQFTLWGMLCLFFILSFRSSIEPHWTLAAGISFTVLLHETIRSAAGRLKKIFFILCYINIGLILSARIIIALPSKITEKIKPLANLGYEKAWADSIKKYSGNSPVVFQGSYRSPAVYNYYYPGTKAFGYGTVFTRKNQYGLARADEELNNQKVFLIHNYKTDSIEKEIITKKETLYLQSLDSFRAISGMKILWKNKTEEGSANDKREATLTISNESGQTIEVRNSLYISYIFYKTKKDFQASPGNILIQQAQLLPREKKESSIKLILPKKPGEYKLIFSVLQPGLEGTIASPIYHIKVE